MSLSHCCRFQDVILYFTVSLLLMLSLGIHNGQLSSLNKCKKVHSNVSLPFETDSYIVNNTTFTWVFVYLGGLIWIKR